MGFSPWPLGRLSRAVIYLLFAFSAYMVPRAYTLLSYHYLVLADYMTGHERLPFQRRVLPMLLLRLLENIPIPAKLMQGRLGLFANPALIDMFAIDLVAFLLASYFCVLLYRKAAPQGKFGLLVYPIFVHAVVWTYLIHTEQNNYFQYDMLSLAFFAAGLCCIYTRRFSLLVLVLLLGSFNRETTLFFIPLFVLDAAAGSGWRDWRRFPWAKTLVLVVVWLAVRLLLRQFYVDNDASEAYLRVSENLRRLAPQHWAEVLGGCGFLLPVIWLLRRRVPDRRIAAWLTIVPMWVVIMFCYGVLTETRIYGELCPLVAVASALLLDAYCMGFQAVVRRDEAPAIFDLGATRQSDVAPD